MKKNKLKTILLIFILPFFSWQCNVDHATKKSTQPNIILIFADDLGYADLGCQGSEDIISPNIDKLAAEGVRFTAGYVTAPQCGPSRAGLMTGLNQARFGYFDNKGNHGLQTPNKVSTIAEYLHEANYINGIIGKWHIGDEPEYSNEVIENSRPWNRGFDYVLMHNRGMSHYFPYREDGRIWMTSRDREPKLTEVKEGSKENSLKNYPEDAYLTDIISQESVNFIKRHKDKAFFLYVAYNAPHTPLVAKEADMLANDHISDPQRRTFAAMMTALDRGVGQIRDELKNQNIEENTLVFFISDNGGPTSQNTSKNDPFAGVKGDVLEGGIRIPFLSCWPGVIPGGQVIDWPVSSLDVLPTAAALAGVKLDQDLNYMGKNLVPYMKGEIDHSPHEWLVWRWRNKIALRHGSFKVVEPLEDLSHSGLYNLEENTKETPENQVSDPEKYNQLKQKLKEWNETMVNSIE